MNCSKALTILLMIICLCSECLAGNGWPQPQGKGYFKLYEWWIVANRHYTDAGLIDPNITNALYNTSVYAEYGFSHKLTGILYFPLFSRNVQNNQISATTGEVIKSGEALNAIGDADIGIRYGLTKSSSRWALSIALIMGLPLGESSDGRNSSLQTGDGEFNQMVQFSVGTSFGSANQHWYVKLHTGLNNRTNNFSDEFRHEFELGTGLTDKLWLLSRLQGIHSLKNGKTSAEINSTSIFANNAEILNIGFEANYYLSNHLGISAGFTTPLYGKIIFAAPAYSVGVFYDMQGKYGY